MTSFPQELIELVVEACAAQGGPFPSLLSVSRAFRTPARRILFSKVTIEWKVGKEDEISPWPKFDLLMDILSDSPELLRFIEEVTFRFERPHPSSPEATDPDMPDSSIKSTAEILSRAPIRELVLIGEHDQIFPWGLMRIPLAIRHNPSFRSLKISGFTCIFPQLILGRAPGDGLTSLEMSDCSMIYLTTPAHQAKTSPTDHIPGLTLTKLRHLSICHGSQREPGEFLLIMPLQSPPPAPLDTNVGQPAAKLFPSLKTIRLEVKRDWQAVLRVLDSLMKHAPVLEDLHLETINMTVDDFGFEQLADENTTPGPFGQLRKFLWSPATTIDQISKSLDNLASFVERFGRVDSSLVEVILNFRTVVGFSQGATMNELAKGIFKQYEVTMPPAVERLNHAVNVGSTSVEKVGVNILIRLRHTEQEEGLIEGAPEVCMNGLKCGEVEEQLPDMVLAQFVALNSVKKVSLGVEVEHD